MTTPRVEQIVTRRSRRETLASSLAARLGEIVASATGIAWPSTKYQKDILGFAREVCGLTLWSRQEEILLAAQNHKRVTVRSGHKIGKSTCAVIIALWFYCSFPRARVILTSATAKQIDDILWSELKRVLRGALIQIDGEPHKIARSGLESGDRKIWGFTAREVEAAAGYSGPNILFIVDEASGVDDGFFEVIEGNRASSGSRLLLFSNPTRTDGEFFRSHEDKKEFYHCIAVSSEETPNVVEGRDIIPGLAGADWVEEKKLEWGEQSPLYKVRVRGEFVKNEDGKIISVHAIEQAEIRWHEQDGAGRLTIGVDPAGPAMGGDETVIAVRRGLKIFQLYPFRALTDEAIVEHVWGISKEHRRRDDTQIPVVVLDREGPIGSRVLGLLQAHSQRYFGSFDVVGVRSSDRAKRKPEVYDRVRDELWMNLSEWIRDGGAIPADTKLAKELHAPAWEGQVTGRIKATSKDDLRKLLDGRSPDRADACALAVWNPTDYSMALSESEARENTAERNGDVSPYDGIDPYEPDGATGYDAVYGR